MRMCSCLLECWNLKNGIFNKTKNTFRLSSAFSVLLREETQFQYFQISKYLLLKGGLTLTATDLVMELSESLVATVKTVGGVTISSQLFLK